MEGRAWSDIEGIVGEAKSVIGRNAERKLFVSISGHNDYIEDRSMLIKQLTTLKLKQIVHRQPKKLTNQPRHQQQSHQFLPKPITTHKITINYSTITNYISNLVNNHLQICFANKRQILISLTIRLDNYTIYYHENYIASHWIV